MGECQTHMDTNITLVLSTSCGKGHISISSYIEVGLSTSDQMTAGRITSTPLSIVFLFYALVLQMTIVHLAEEEIIFQINQLTFWLSAKKK